MAATFTSKYHFLLQLLISLAGLNDICIKLYIQIILLYKHQIMFVYILNLFVLV